VAESSVLSFATPHAQAQRRLDDFARVVAIRHPGQGWQFARHDEAGRLLETIDPRGARQRARWDLAGRLVRLERFAPGAEAGTTAEQVIDRRYEHERLTGTPNPTPPPSTRAYGKAISLRGWGPATTPFISAR
jgi:YD repeat-containing protein